MKIEGSQQLISDVKMTGELGNPLRTPYKPPMEIMKLNEINRFGVHAVFTGKKKALTKIS